MNLNFLLISVLLLSQSVTKMQSFPLKSDKLDMSACTMTRRQQNQDQTRSDHGSDRITDRIGSRVGSRITDRIGSRVGSWIGSDHGKKKIKKINLG